MRTILAACIVIATATVVHAHTCTVPNTVYVPAMKGCVAHVTDQKEFAKATLPDGSAYEPDLADDPKCKGQPDGYKYDVAVVGPDGAKGVAHKVCGIRPTR